MNRDWLRVLLVAGLAMSVLPSSAQPPARPGGGPRVPASLAHAILVAEQQTGGRARKAEMEREQGIDVYEVKTVSKDTSAKVLVDHASGTVLRVTTPGIVSAIGAVFDGDDRRKEQAALARLEASSLTLVAAVPLAEKESGGRAVKATLTSRYGSTLFEVRVVKDLTTQTMVIDPVTAKVVTAPATGKREGHDD